MTQINNNYELNGGIEGTEGNGTSGGNRATGCNREQRELGATAAEGNGEQHGRQDEKMRPEATRGSGRLGPR